jgi:soluble lytic murein transglycosylase-like protein
VRVRMNLIAAVGAFSLGAGAAVAAAAEPVADEVLPQSPQADVLDGPGERLHASIEADRQLDRMREAHRRLASQATAVGVEAGDPPQDIDELKKEIDALRERIDHAASSNSVAGVPRSTLESIASCESGGDPTAVSSDGTYRGKYQFDRSTWASVGGSGDPAAAPEVEQDYRAALLYQRSGASAWPVCG